MQNTAMCWGFDCGDGWYNILDALCASIQNYADRNQLSVVATQVKEKYGTLRFYYNGGDDVVNELVEMAEYISGLTCEECGAPGKMTDNGWFKTLCERHKQSSLLSKKEGMEV